jgi:ketosteroid isomerase-like protein
LRLLPDRPVPLARSPQTPAQVPEAAALAVHACPPALQLWRGRVAEGACVLDWLSRVLGAVYQITTIDATGRRVIRASVRLWPSASYRGAIATLDRMMADDSLILVEAGSAALAPERLQALSRGCADDATGTVKAALRCACKLTWGDPAGMAEGIVDVGSDGTQPGTRRPYVAHATIRDVMARVRAPQPGPGRRVWGAFLRLGGSRHGAVAPHTTCAAPAQRRLVVCCH